MSKSEFTMTLAAIPDNAPLLLRESMTRMNKIAEAASKNILDRSAILHDLSVELSFIGEKKLYEQTNNKSLAEFAEQKFGIEKSMTYTLARAGSFYRSDKVPDEVKALPPTTISQLSALDNSADREAVFNKIVSGEISTQKEVRDAVAAANPLKPKAPKFYAYGVEGNATMYGVNLTFNADTTIEYPNGDRYRLQGKYIPFEKSEDVKESWYLAVDENNTLVFVRVVSLSKSEYNEVMEELSKPKPLTKEERIAQLMKQLEELQAE